ncbi:hypothetical protein [Salmonella enterica]|uniref:hypothetical protein n=1 Tax=Salmonella enterica TaxID=28901 RepID=UPI001F263625|nr:hypothetical protein [Salmonella enterica]
MAKTKWPKLPRFFVPLFHSANVYLCRSKEEWDQACIHLGVGSGGNEMLAGQHSHIAIPKQARIFTCLVYSMVRRPHWFMNALTLHFMSAEMLV